MICIFCNRASSGSTSIEHIIPESLGNTKNILPKGVVCDECNGYFGRKIEGPVLNLPFFGQLRARNAIQSKKKRIPPEELLIFHPEVECDDHRGLFLRNTKGLPCLSVPWEIGKRLFSKASSTTIITESLHQNCIPTENVLISRFLAKIGYESLAQLALDNWADLNLILSDQRLYPIRNFARFAKSGEYWPYYTRKLYDEDKKFFYSNDLTTPVDVLYQYKHFFIEDEMFLTTIFKGHEFTINLGRPNIDSYIRWLLINKGESFAYDGSNLIYNGLQQL